MSRRYEVSFRADLDDRECDEVADILWGHGWDDICFRPLPLYSEGVWPVSDKEALENANQHDIQTRLK